MVELKGLPGFRDFYPEELAARSYLMGVWRDVARRYGFEEYDGPPLEALELYTRKSGEEIVQQLYEFEDKGGRRVALRPEMTPSLARMVGVRAAALRKPVRWFSTPQLFRYERKQRGRLREHFQLNLDILGEEDVLADADLLAAAIDIMRATGLDSTQVRARVSDRRVLAAIFLHIGVPETKLESVYEVVDKLDREPRDRLEARLAELGLEPDAIAGVFDATELRGIEELRARFGDVPSVAERVAELATYLEHLENLGVVEFVDVDLSVVRGLAYYTGIVFELWDAGRKLRAICGGGRYDDLLGLIAGIDMPAIGFGMGDVVLTELLRDHGLLPEPGRALDCFVCWLGADGRRQALRAARAIRALGLSAIFEFRDRRLGNQLKSADQLGARRAVIVGPQEIEASQARIRDMSTGEERVVPFDELGPTLAAELGDG
ncbi:MAG: histidine--tRNA ligase [Gemmatimonadota bacterium]|nr:MAG: histidine--tRNA ligase [Gemmatimonadota bacterium]